MQNKLHLSIGSWQIIIWVNIEDIKSFQFDAIHK